MILYEVDGKLIVGKGDADPLRCPSCHRFIPNEKLKELRCPSCQFKGNAKEFKAQYVEIGQARILAYL